MKLVDRVSVFFLAALAVCLAGYSIVGYALIRNHLEGRFDERLRNGLSVLVAAVEVESDDVKWQPSDHTINLGDEPDADELRWVIADELGRIMDRSRNLDSSSAADRELIDALNDADGASRQTISGRPWTFLRTTLAATDPKPETDRDPDEAARVLVAVAGDSASLEGELRWLALLLCGLPVALWFAAAVLGRQYCRRALAPVREMAQRARSTKDADFRLRLDIGNQTDELSDLAASFNSMLDRLEEAFDRQRRFAGDAAHQLRTPLTVLRGEIEVALRRSRTAEEYQRALTTLHGQTVDLQRLVESLLFLADASARGAPPDVRIVSLAEWLPSFVAQRRSLPRGEDIVVEADRGARVSVSLPLLSQALDNLLDNAAKYSPPGSVIVVRAQAGPATVDVSVEDQGIGVPPAQRASIFEPFYRTPEARRSGATGNGLGLALVGRIAHILGADVVCAEKFPRGSRFILRFKAVPVADSTS